MPGGGTRLKPDHLVFHKKQEHPSGRIDVLMSVDSEQEALSDLEDFGLRTDSAIFLVNVALLRRFYPCLTIFTNNDEFESDVQSPLTRYLRVPVTFQWHQAFSHSKELHSYFVDGKTVDPIWFGCEVGGGIMNDSGVTLAPIFLLSDKEVNIESLGNLFDHVNDFNGAMDALLDVFSVAILSCEHPSFKVMTKDPDVVSFLEKAPKEEDAYLHAWL